MSKQKTEKSLLLNLEVYLYQNGGPWRDKFFKKKEEEKTDEKSSTSTNPPQSLKQMKL